MLITYLGLFLFNYIHLTTILTKLNLFFNNHIQFDYLLLHSLILEYIITLVSA